MTNPKTDNPELNLATLFADYADEDKARGLLESLRWPNGPVCPHCAVDKPYKLTAKAYSKCPVRAGLYKCRTHSYTQCHVGECYYSKNWNGKIDPKRKPA